jgi:hypothetical protein
MTKGESTKYSSNYILLFILLENKREENVDSQKGGDKT